MKQLIITAGIMAFFVSVAQAEIRITEWMYSSQGAGEFIEFTNVGDTAIDMSGWSFDDDSRVAGTVDLSAFDTVASGESVILTEAPEADFRTDWSLPSTVKIIGDNPANLGRNDEINLYDASDILVDRLTYGDQNISGSIRTQYISGNPLSPAVLGMNDVTQWVLSSVGDAYGSYASASADVGNPGYYVPEPTSLALLLSGLLSVCALAYFRRSL
jgi:predicted extracellular nuclease